MTSQSYPEIERLRALNQEQGAPTVTTRLQALRKLREGLLLREGQLLDALQQDTGKAPVEGYIAEFDQSRRELDHFIRKTKSWARNRRVQRTLMHAFSSAYITPQPFGLVYIMAPWNYPLQLSIMPLTAALAAGNRVVLSLSTKTPKTNAAIRTLIQTTIGDDLVWIVDPDRPGAREVYKSKFDFIFFTGSAAFGRQVATSAAGNLTPCALELGGKSPVLINQTTSLSKVARRITWGKLLNAGQTCIAPDYVMIEQREVEEFVGHIITNIKQSYGDDPQLSADYPRIISSEATERLGRLLEGLDVQFGGQFDPESRYIAPTVVVNPPSDHPIMQEEIFGPILPIIGYNDFNEAIEFVRQREKPLAIYFFGAKEPFQKVLSLQTGGICRGDTIMHVSHQHLPFGGVGASGYGRYHGKAGFDLFSNLRSVLDAGASPEISARYPPYAPLATIKKMLKYI